MANKKRRNDTAVAALRERVVLYYEADHSYLETAQQFAISKAYVVKLVQSYRAEMRRAGAGHIALTARQRRFARALISGKSPPEAAIHAARPRTLSPAEAQAWADETLWDENFRTAIRQIYFLETPGQDETVDVPWDNPTTNSGAPASQPTPAPPARPDEDEIEWEDEGYVAIGEDG